jgi:acyl carrier protein
MTKEEITRKVVELAAAQVGVDPATVTPDTHFINDLNYDSLDQVEFAMEAEDEFEMQVPDEDAEKFQTVGQVIEYVEKNVKEWEESVPQQSPPVAPH